MGKSTISMVIFYFDITRGTSQHSGDISVTWHSKIGEMGWGHFFDFSMSQTSWILQNDHGWATKTRPWSYISHAFPMHWPCISHWFIMHLRSIYHRFSFCILQPAFWNHWVFHQTSDFFGDPVTPNHWSYEAAGCGVAVLLFQSGGPEGPEGPEGQAPFMARVRFRLVKYVWIYPETFFVLLITWCIYVDLMLIELAGKVGLCIDKFHHLLSYIYIYDRI